MYIITMDTPHFQWTAAGETLAEAETALTEAWNAVPTTAKMTAAELQEVFGFHLLVIEAGQAYRDYTQMPRT